MKAPKQRIILLLLFLLGSLALYLPQASNSAETKVAQLLTVSKTGAGASTGTVTSAPAGIACGTTCSATFEDSAGAQTVTLTAAPASGFVVSGWTGCTNASGNSCSVLVNSNKTVTVNFDAIPAGQAAVVVTKAGTGSGTVTSSPAAIDCGATCSANLPITTPAAAITLSATAASGSIFRGWTGACKDFETNSTCIISINESKNVGATFSLPFELSVRLTGNGQGLVTSDPVGINCGTICQFSWSESRSVTLTSIAAEGSGFKGWWNATVCKSSPSKTCVVSVPQEGIEIRAKFIKPPKAKITYGPKERTTKSKAFFKFRGTKKATFKCSIDFSPWKKCRSPERFYNLGLGGHVFMVKPYIGEVAGKRAIYKWKVVSKKSRR